MTAKKTIFKKENLETYHFTNKRPQPNRICTHQKILFAIRDPTNMQNMPLVTLWTGSVVSTYGIRAIHWSYAVFQGQICSS